MLQKKFVCKDSSAIEDAIEQIAELIRSTTHKSALITFYEKGFTKEEIGALVDRMKGWGFPELQIAGISVALVAENMPEGTGIHLNLVLTEEADIEVVTMPCRPGSEQEASKTLKERMEALPHVKAIELFSSNMELKVTDFMDGALSGRKDIVLFGTSTLRNLMQSISQDEDAEAYAVSQAETGVDKDEFIVGDEILPHGFVAVLFAGEKLHVKSEYALGWKPIGRSFEIELGDNPTKGESVVTKINGRPAVEIYHEYLGVFPDQYFIGNICEFPLAVERNGYNICMVPLEYGENGEVRFMIKLYPEDRLRFTFASHDEVLYASLESLFSMSDFGPEAMFLTLCGNRLNFLKGDAKIEWEGFGQVAPDYALMHGAGEISYFNGNGGVLNSAHLTVGMRESDVPASHKKIEEVPMEEFRKDKILSLPDRMSTFLTKITGELLDMAREAEDANHAKSRFLSHMSHEIRTPINAVLGMNDMILKESKEESTLEYADNIRSAGNNLLGIVNDILDLSKIEAGKMDIIPCEYELKTAIKDMYNVVHLRAEEKGLKVTLDIDENLPTGVLGDVTRINQVVMNLLTNAVKYTETGEVTLSIRKVAENRPEDAEFLAKACPCDRAIDKFVRIHVAVKDTGIGIRPEDLKKLFGEYERFDEERNRNIEGTGLGMSITREFLDLMGSSLDVRSTYGEGSEFGFDMVQGLIDATPIGDVDVTKKVVSKVAYRPFTAKDARVLVVDDTPLNLKVVEKHLQDTKIVVDKAMSGEEALRLVKEHAYDVILLDHLMPGISGPETLEAMKTLEGNLSAGVPVISLTSNAGADVREEYLKMGFNDFLSKPFKSEELGEVLLRYIPPEKVRAITE